MPAKRPVPPPDTDPQMMIISDTAAPLRADAVQNRAEILAAAQRLFAQDGVGEVSMSQIARAAAVGKGTLYRHFRSKADLCLALLDGQQRALQNHALHYLRTTHAPPDVLLMWFLGEVLDFIDHNVELLAESSEARLISQALDFDHPAHHWQWQTIHGLLSRLHPTGDVEYLADTLYALLDARLYRFQRMVRGYAHERIRTGLAAAAQRLIAG
jgi:AcrR family transcriptional regulator